MRIAASILVLAALVSTAIGQGLPPPPVPPGNPITPAKTNLGKTLFWDEQLSSARTVACGSCHVMTGGGSDPRASFANAASLHPGLDVAFGGPDDVVGSPGVPRTLFDGSYDKDSVFRLAPQVTPRRSMSVINSAYPDELFWDGRASSTFLDPITGAVVLFNNAALESQAIGPPTNSVEMGHEGRDWNDVAARLSSSAPLRLAPSVPPALATWIGGRTYPELFQEAFGTNAITAARIAMALATYQRTLVSNQSPFDQALAGNPNALTPLENQGRQLFNSPLTSCGTCHGGPRLTVDGFFYTGVRPQSEDFGRFVVTGDPADLGRMRVPTLRNVELRAPYFHNGRFATLEDVVEFYDRGGDFDAPNKPVLLIRPLGLAAQQKAALVAFMKRPLTDPRVEAGLSPFDHPTLYATSSHAPLAFGVATPGSGAFAPEMIALEPPAVGIGSIRFAIDRGLAGRQAILAIDSVGIPRGVPFQGATLYLGLGASVTLHRIAALGGVGAGEGFGSKAIAMPSDPASIGTSVFAQWFVLDPAPGRRFSTSSAVEVTYY
jgi:cytochrome c peroxidase